MIDATSTYIDPLEAYQRDPVSEIGHQATVSLLGINYVPIYAWQWYQDECRYHPEDDES